MVGEITTKDRLLTGLLVALMSGASALFGCTRQALTPTELHATTRTPVETKPVTPTADQESLTPTRPQEGTPTTEEASSRDAVSPAAGSESPIFPSSPRESEEVDKECYKDPRRALEDFLSYLHNGIYDKAATLYGGDYGTLQNYNPDVDPHNRPKLLERWCTVNGGMCLAPKIVASQTLSEDRFDFTVVFFHDDGTALEIKPLAGEKGKPVKGRYHYEVVRVSDHYKIMQLPPYQP